MRGSVQKRVFRLTMTLSGTTPQFVASDQLPAFVVDFVVLI